jgi:hypothetical protein
MQKLANIRHDSVIKCSDAKLGSRIPGPMQSNTCGARVIALTIQGVRPPSERYSRVHPLTQPLSIAARALPRRVLTVSLAWLICLWLAAPHARAEDGHELWLRYHALPQPWVERYRAVARELVMARSPADTAQAELARGLAGLLGAAPTISDRITQDGAILIGTPQSSASIATLNLGLEGLGSEGFVIRSLTISGHRATVIAANTSAGVIFGVFHFLRLLQTLQAVESLALVSVPQLRYRVLDHWDNLDGTVERGYAGASIWDWHKLPGYLAPRYLEYARACASIGINGTVVNNVNADPLILTPAYLEKLAALAGVLRPLRNQSLYCRAIRGADRTRRVEDRGPTRSCGAHVVAAQGRGDLSLDSRFRRIPRQGQFRRPAGSSGLRPFARRRRQSVRRGARATRRRGDVARIRLFERSTRGSHQAGFQRIRAARRPVPRQCAAAGQERPHWTFSRASPFIRCSAQCRGHR